MTSELNVWPWAAPVKAIEHVPVAGVRVNAQD